MGQMIESVLQRLLLARLNQLPEVWFRRQNTGAVKTSDRYVKFGTKGQGDLVGIVRSRYAEVECKSVRGRLSEEQRAHRDRVISAGGLYVVAKAIEDEPAESVVKRVFFELGI